MTRQLQLPVDNPVKKPKRCRTDPLLFGAKSGSLSSTFSTPPLFKTEKKDLQEPNGSWRDGAVSENSKSESSNSKNGAGEKAQNEVQKLVGHYVEIYHGAHNGRRPLATWTAQVGRWVKTTLPDRSVAALEPVLAELARTNKTPNALSGILMDQESFSAKGLTLAGRGDYRPYSNLDWGWTKEATS